MYYNAISIRRGFASRTADETEAGKEETSKINLRK